jgi:preprotein translocase SecE subunit
VARDRQRAKQRQAERRARRLAERGEGDGQARGKAPEPPEADPVVDERHPETAGGAPPEELGRSDQVLEPVTSPGDADELDDVDPELAADAEEAGAFQSVDDEYAPQGRRGTSDMGGDPTGKARGRPRFVQFLVAVWAELQRVQWPDRPALTTLTGVVLGFVLLAGGYLGLLDAIFSRIIQAIL